VYFVRGAPSRTTEKLPLGTTPDTVNPAGPLAEATVVPELSTTDTVRVAEALVSATPTVPPEVV
jgi:hypothetical protein